MCIRDRIKRFFSSIPDAQEPIDLFENINFQTCLNEEFGRFKQACNCIAVKSDSVDLPKLIDDYFQITPPFGMGKKRKEFPDAIAAHSLLNWAKENRKKISIISNDKDWMKFCERHESVQYFETILEFLSTFPAPELVDRIKRGFKSVEKLFLSQVARDFPLLGFILVSSRYTPDVVEDVSVVDINFEDLFVINIEKNEESFIANIEVSAKINFEAEATYEDPATGYYDKEDDVHFGMEFHRQRIEQEWEGFVHGEVHFKTDEVNDLTLTNVSIDVIDIEVFLDEDDYW